MISPLLLFPSILLIGFLCQWLAWRIKLPAILLFLISGLLLGPTFHLINPSNLFGDYFFIFISLAVSIILFEGSLTLKRHELKDIGKVVTKMVTIGALVNAFITTLATHWLIGLNWQLSMLLGAIMVVTGPTVIIPLLRIVKPNEKIANTLRWEGIVIDPLGALFTVLIFEGIVAQINGTSLAHASEIFFKTIITGLFFGIASGYLFGLLLRHRWIPDYLQNFGTLAAVCMTFALSNTLMHESGLLAVTIMGIWLANMRNVNTDSILHFKENLTVLLVATLFIILAANVNPDDFKTLGWGAVGLLFIMQFISRPIKVFLSTWNSSFTKKEKILLSWIGPRGIVAAAISALFALQLENLGVAQAELLSPLAFVIIIGTVIIQSATARPLANMLNLSEPEAKGYLIVGANPVARQIGHGLIKAGYRIQLSDTSWDNVAQARMENLPTFYGNLLSESADTHVDLIGIGGLLGLSHHADRNSLAILKYRIEFDDRQIFSLATSQEDTSRQQKHQISTKHRGQILFNTQVTYGKLMHIISQGGEVKSTKLSKEFTFEQWQQHKANKKSIPLFALDGKGTINWFYSEHQPQIEENWQLFSLSAPLKQTD